jgi:hypothetical protein
VKIPLEDTRYERPQSSWEPVGSSLPARRLPTRETDSPAHLWNCGAMRPSAPQADPILPRGHGPSRLKVEGRELRGGIGSLP